MSIRKFDTDDLEAAIIQLSMAQDHINTARTDIMEALNHDEDVQHDLDATLARRDQANTPWLKPVDAQAFKARSFDPTGGATMPLASDSAAKARQRETGSREHMICILPFSWETDKCPEHTLCVFAELEHALVNVFGGYSMYDGKGGWCESKLDATAIHEPHRRYEVVYAIAPIRPRDKALELFESAGERLGEDWLHIETFVTSAHHVKVGD